MNIKKIVLCILVIVFAATAFALDIESALQKTAEQFSMTIKKGTTIAIIGISSPTLEMSEFMLDEITLDFVQQHKLTVANRANLEAIKTEMNFQLSGEVSDESIQQLGAMVGANVVIHGSLKPLGKDFNLVVQALDVTSATVLDMCRFSIEQNAIIKSLLNGKSVPATNTRKKNAPAKEKKAAASAATVAPAVADVPKTLPAPKNANPQPTQVQKPKSAQSASDDYTIIDLRATSTRDVEDNFKVYNRANVPIQVIVYAPGASNDLVYVGSILLKQQSSGSISELNDKKVRPAYYGIKVVDTSGGAMKFLVNWDTGNHDLRIYVQPSFL